MMNCEKCALVRDLLDEIQAKRNEIQAKRDENWALHDKMQDEITELKDKISALECQLARIGIIPCTRRGQAKIVELRKEI